MVRPRLYKDYLDALDEIPLPSVVDELEEVDTMKTLQSNEDREERFLYLESLARVLYFSAGVTKTLTRGERTFELRAASCTGALFHIELYVITARLPGLRAGIYHYDPEKNCLQLLRKGDYRQHLVTATGSNYHCEDSPTTIVYTSNIWRNAYKYQGRAYRHAFWDAGVIIANSLAMASEMTLSAKVVTAFVDTAIARLVGIDIDKEFPLALLPLGFTGHPGFGTELPEPEPPVFVAKDQELERSYPPLNAVATLTSLTTAEEVSVWRDQELRLSLPKMTDGIQLRPQSTRKIETQPLEQTIMKRGSTRKFNHDPLDLIKFSNLLKMGTLPFQADFYKEFGRLFSRVYVVINAVDQLQTGSYRYYPEKNQLQPLKQGYMREQTKLMGLNQALAHDCAAMIVFVADLSALMAKFGDRAYRVAQLEGSILAGKMYLAAYAQQFGATGLTFFDDEVTTFFDESDKIVTFMILVGRKAQKPQN